MAYGTINADVIQSSVPGVSLGAGDATRFKNRIINGNMVIDQRNAGASVTPTNGQYLVDRWQAVASQASKYSVQQNAGSVTPPTGFINYLGATSLSAYSIGAGDYFSIAQTIEGLNIADLGWGTANAKTITLSFQVYSSLTGTFGGVLRNASINRSYPFSYTVSSANTWTQISITIAGDTSGTWLTTNGVGVFVNFSLGSGSTFSGTAGAWAAANYLSATGAVSVVGTSGATFYITGVQFEVGSSATGFEVVDITTQTAMCQRYYELLGTNALSIYLESYAGSTPAAATANFIFAVQKRTAPTMSAIGTFTTSNTTLSTITVNALSANNFSVYFLAAATGRYFGYNDVNTKLIATAEL